jgi:hypothetical protein
MSTPRLKMLAIGATGSRRVARHLPGTRNYQGPVLAAPAHVIATWLTLSQESAIRAPMRTRPADSCRS